MKGAEHANVLRLFDQPGAGHGHDGAQNNATTRAEAAHALERAWIECVACQTLTSGCMSRIDPSTPEQAARAPCFGVEEAAWRQQELVRRVDQYLLEQGRAGRPPPCTQAAIAEAMGIPRTSQAFRQSLRAAQICENFRPREWTWERAKGVLAVHLAKRNVHISGAHDFEVLELQDEAEG